jgi:predicted esterase
MRIVKVVTLALVAFQLIGCAAESTTEEVDNTTVNAPAEEPKDLFNAPLPASEATGEAPKTASGSVIPTLVPKSEEPAKDDDDAEEPAPAPAPAPVASPGPKPASTCSVTKDSLGFFNRNSGKSDYVAFVPASYSKDKPMRLVVGLHGCGDNALNFAKWAVNPWDTRAKQQHIGISVGGETGGGKCWNIGGDDAKVMAAVEDIAKCYWIDRSKIVLAGYSSGGQLAYRVGLKQADKFAGILIENSGLYAAGDTPAKLTAGASWKINIAHSAHTGDGVFPIAKVQADWTTIRNAGLPLKSQAIAGGHDGDGKEWANWLIPASAGWVKP